MISTSGTLETVMGGCFVNKIIQLFGGVKLMGWKKNGSKGITKASVAQKNEKVI